VRIKGSGLRGVEYPVLDRLGETKWVKDPAHADAIVMDPPGCLKDALVPGIKHARTKYWT
jgi:hypothetical protein